VTEASDNVYLHKDFHGALSVGIDYLEENFGEEAVREYLRDFTNTYFAPLKEEVKQRGQKEGGEAEITLNDNELIVRVAACPAVTHMHQHGYAVTNMFYETTKTVNEALIADTDFAAELVEYDEETGRSVQRFYRRQL